MIGKCCVCGKKTDNKESFCDDWDIDELGNMVSGTSYEDWCHEECYDHLISKSR
jgi:hypothetical protein